MSLKFNLSISTPGTSHTIPQACDTFNERIREENMNLNLSASLNVFRLLAKPSLCLPHATVSTFNDLPIPLDSAFDKDGQRRANIRAVVLDKDDCFAFPESNEVYADYKVEHISLPDLTPLPSLSAWLVLSPRMC